MGERSVIHRVLGGGNQWVRDHLGDPGLDGRVIL